MNSFRSRVHPCNMYPWNARAAKMPRPEPTAKVGPTHAWPERKWKRTASLPSVESWMMKRPSMEIG
jgi:hypothetical protein